MALGDTPGTRVQNHVAAIFTAQGFPVIVEVPPVPDEEDILAEPDGDPVEAPVTVIEVDRRVEEKDTPVGGKLVGVFEFLAPLGTDIKTSYWVVDGQERYEVKEVRPQRAWGTVQVLRVVAERVMD